MSSPTTSTLACESYGVLANPLLGALDAVRLSAAPQRDPVVVDLDRNDIVAACATLPNPAVFLLVALALTLSTLDRLNHRLIVATVTVHVSPVLFRCPNLRPFLFALPLCWALCHRGQVHLAAGCWFLPHVQALSV